MSQIINNTTLTKWKTMIKEKKIEKQMNVVKKLILKFYIHIENAMKRDQSCFYPRVINNRTFLTPSDVYDSANEFVFMILFQAELLSYASIDKTDSEFLKKTISNITSFMKKHNHSLKLSEEQLCENNKEMDATLEYYEIFDMLSDYGEKHNEISTSDILLDFYNNIDHLPFLARDGYYL